MTLRRLTAALAATALLTACAGDDTTDADADAPTDQVEDGATDDTDDVDDGAGDDADDAADEQADGDAAAGGSQLLTVGLWFDGQRVPIATSCNGADGAVLATTEGEVTITLVHEESTALRYNGEGMTAETDDVEVEEVGESTIYRATLESDQVPAVEVQMEVGDTSVLEDC